MSRTWVDSNVIVRFITGDPPDMARRAERLFSRVDRGDTEVVIDPIVIAECVWVLSSFYGFGANAIAQTLGTFVARPGVICDQKTEVLRALAMYDTLNADFVDALLAVRMLGHGDTEVYSFDKHFDRIGGIARREPPREETAQTT